jgi:hypothetical protein
MLRDFFWLHKIPSFKCPLAQVSRPVPTCYYVLAPQKRASRGAHKNSQQKKVQPPWYHFFSPRIFMYTRIDLKITAISYHPHIRGQFLRLPAFPANPNERTKAVKCGQNRTK